jgi:hypothetical protein
LEHWKIQRTESPEEDSGNLSSGKWIFCFILANSNSMKSVHSLVPGCYGLSWTPCLAYSNPYMVAVIPLQNLALIFDICTHTKGVDSALAQNGRCQTLTQSFLARRAMPSFLGLISSLNIAPSHGPEFWQNLMTTLPGQKQRTKTDREKWTDDQNCSTRRPFNLGSWFDTRFLVVGNT